MELDSAKSGLHSKRIMGKAALPATRSRLMYRKQSWKVYRMVLIWVITTGQNFEHWDSIVLCFVAASMFSHQENCTENVQLQTGAPTQQTQLYQPKPKLYSACEW